MHLIRWLLRPLRKREGAHRRRAVASLHGILSLRVHRNDDDDGDDRQIIFTGTHDLAGSRWAQRLTKHSFSDEKTSLSEPLSARCPNAFISSSHIFKPRRWRRTERCITFFDGAMGIHVWRDAVFSIEITESPAGRAARRVLHDRVAGGARGPRTCATCGSRSGSGGKRGFVRFLFRRLASLGRHGDVPAVVVRVARGRRRRFHRERAAVERVCERAHGLRVHEVRATDGTSSLGLAFPWT